MTDKMNVWNALKTTDPKYTKKVEFGRKFTSINSQWQLQRMTEQFGPIGQGWGYNVDHAVERITDDYVLAVADVAIWWRAEDKVAQYGPVRGMSPIVEKGKDKLHFDDDAGKKAMTDALTKGLSHLGLSADVFLGLFDDNKYVQKVAAQFSNPADFAEEAVKDGLAKNTTSTYEVEKRKTAETFVTRALFEWSILDGQGIKDWYSANRTPRSTNRDFVTALADKYPDLHQKLETAAEEVRLRDGARAA